MPYPSTAAAALLTVCFTSFACLPSSAGAVEPALSPQPGVLILRNGRVLAGRITRAGDRYLVALGAEDEVSLPAEDVEFHCRTLQEAYHLKRAALRPAHLADHLDLADWCLRYELHREAAEQLLAAIALDPKAARIEQLERRLQVALNQPDPTPQASGLPRPTVSAEEVERTVLGLPPGSLERFTGHIQPLLINRCGNGGCHGGRQTSGFRLNVPSVGFGLTTRLTQRNLYATLHYIHRPQPSASPLLEQAGRAHGGLNAPVFRDHEQDKLELLRAWVLSLRDDRGSLASSSSRQTPEPPDTLPSTSQYAPAGIPTASGIARVGYEQPLGPLPAGSGTPPAGSLPQPGPSQPGSPAPPDATGIVPGSAMPGNAAAPGNVLGSQGMRGADPNSSQGVGAPGLLPNHPGSISRLPSPVAGDSSGGGGGEPLPSSAATTADRSPRPLGRDPFDPEIFNRRYFPAPAGTAASLYPTAGR